jgi:hypothetical protein
MYILSIGFQKDEPSKAQARPGQAFFMKKKERKKEAWSQSSSS